MRERERAVGVRVITSLLQDASGKERYLSRIIGDSFFFFWVRFDLVGWVEWARPFYKQQSTKYGCWTRFAIARLGNGILVEKMERKMDLGLRRRQRGKDMDNYVVVLRKRRKQRPEGTVGGGGRKDGGRMACFFLPSHHALSLFPRTGNRAKKIAMERKSRGDEETQRQEPSWKQ